MSNDNRHGELPDEHADDDPVGALFARERSEIHPLPADDLHWQRIVVEAGRRRRRPFLAYAAGGLAAAAVVVLAVVLGGGLLPIHHAQTAGTHPATSTPSSTRQSQPTGPSASHSSGTSTSPSSSSTRPGSTGPTTSGRVTGAVTGPSGITSTKPDTPWVTAVPGSFRVSSLSNPGSRLMYALGIASCGTSSCPVLVGSRNTGTTWSLVASFPGARIYAPDRGNALRVQPSSAISQVRFANSKVGWAFGGGLMYTHDGGVSWRTYHHAGGTQVAALETDGTTVFIATTTRCGQSEGCTGGLTVLAAPIDATSATKVVYRLAASSPGFDDVAISTNANGTYVSSTTTSSGEGTPVRIGSGGSGGSGGSAALPCSVNAYGVVTTSAVVGGPDFEACQVPHVSSGGSIHGVFDIASSLDHGSTWAHQGRVKTAGGAVLSLAATDGSNLVLAVGDTPQHPTPARSLLVSHDGGNTWNEPSTPPKAYGGYGFSWVGAPDSTTFYALEFHPARRYWTSTDDGRTWTAVGFG